jgi:hypothetical protein
MNLHEGIVPELATRGGTPALSGRGDVRGVRRGLGPVKSGLIMAVAEIL